jgi:hypothetical protein
VNSPDPEKLPTYVWAVQQIMKDIDLAVPVPTPDDDPDIEEIVRVFGERLRHFGEHAKFLGRQDDKRNLVGLVSLMSVILHEVHVVEAMVVLSIPEHILDESNEKALEAFGIKYNNPKNN